MVSMPLTIRFNNELPLVEPANLLNLFSKFFNPYRMTETRRLQKIAENWQALMQCFAFLGQESASNIQNGRIDKQHLLDLLQLIIKHAGTMRAEVHLLQLSETVKTQKDIEDLIEKISIDTKA